MTLCLLVTYIATFKCLSYFLRLAGCPLELNSVHSRVPIIDWQTSHRAFSGKLIHVNGFKSNWCTIYYWSVSHFWANWNMKLPFDVNVRLVRDPSCREHEDWFQHMSYTLHLICCSTFDRSKIEGHRVMLFYVVLIIKWLSLLLYER